MYATKVLRSGVTHSPVLPAIFYTARVAAQGSTVTAWWNGVLLAQLADTSTSEQYGMAALGCGWHEACSNPPVLLKPTTK